MQGLTELENILTYWRKFKEKQHKLLRGWKDWLMVKD